MSLTFRFPFVSIFVLLVLFSANSIHANTGSLVGEWLNGSKSGKVKIEERNGKFYGKVVWLDDPNDSEGKPKVNENSPVKEERNDPIIGLEVLKNFTNEDGTKFSGGTVYDPENGKTYKCILTLNGNELKVRGYIGIPTIGRTEVWSKVQ